MESNHNDSHVPTPKRITGIGLAGMAGFVLILLVVFLALGIGPRMRQQSVLNADAQEVHGPLAVQTITPKSSSDLDLELPGDTQAIEETTINARASGYLSKRLVDIGSRVKAGDLLAEIESPEVMQQLVQAQAQTDKSRASIGQAKAEVIRSSAAALQSQSEVYRMQANVQAAKADVAKAQAQVEQSKASVSNANSKLETAQSVLESRKADVAKAASQTDITSKTLARWQKLAKQGAVSQQDLDQKQADYDSAKAAQQSTAATLKSAQSDVEAAKHLVEASQSEVAASEAGVNAAKQSVDAASAAVNSSKAGATAAKAGIQASTASVRAADADLQSNGANTRHFAAMQAFSRITAPFSGVITARNVDVGALINAGGSSDTGTAPRSGLFGIARTDVLRIHVNLPQSAVNGVREGQIADVTVHEYPGRVFKGLVYRLAGALDTSTRTRQAEIHIDNKAGTLLPGMYANVKFAASGRQSLHVPSNVLVVNAQGVRVASVTPDSTIHFLPIKVGKDFGTELEISEGLKGDEKLITSPTDDLREGEKVTASPAPPPPPK